MKPSTLAVLAGMAAFPASAQDFGGINPADLGRGMVMPSAIAAQGKRGGGRSDGLSARSARTCANAARMRGTSAEQERKLQQLRALCRENGYR